MNAPPATARDYLFALIARVSNGDGTVEWCDEARRLLDQVEAEALPVVCDAEGCAIPHTPGCARAAAYAATHDGCTCGRPWEGTPQPHAAHCWLLATPDLTDRLYGALTGFAMATPNHLMQDVAWRLSLADHLAAELTATEPTPASYQGTRGEPGETPDA